jgi:hypothetical protein
MKWPVGNRYVYRQDLERHKTNNVPSMPKPIQEDTSTSMTYSLVVTKEIPGGGREIELEFLANKMELRMGEQVIASFDSKEAGKNETQSPLSAPFRKMIGSKIRVQMDPDGKVDKVIDHQQWISNLVSGAGAVGNLLAQHLNEKSIRGFSGFGSGLPANPVRVGDAWLFTLEASIGPNSRVSFDSTVTFQGIEEHDQHQCVALTLRGAIQASPDPQDTPMGKMTVESGAVEGTSWFDPETGTLIESVQDQAIRMKGDMPRTPGSKNSGAFTMDLGEKRVIKLLELGKANP